MNRIASVFTSGRKALIAYITVGYPALETTARAAAALAASGCDIIELGIPFSDPLADGVTIQGAAHRALLNGVTVKKCLETARETRRLTGVPLLFMGYLNPILHYGLEEFCSACEAAGVDGLIIPDLPPGELPAMEEAAARHGLDIISFLSPNSSDARIGEVAARARGFIYVTSVTGVTGARDNLAAGLDHFIRRVRQRTSLPLCIGFGISDAAQARSAAAIADGAIIGSRIIQLMGEDDSSYAKLQEFMRGVRQAVDS